ncbi:MULTISPECIES: DUF2125 domain-containing protein [Alphaproteobacteria]|uniref:DUF2125 domain-containing protein n=2 Tax=Alphaproteobacteria TaxID=28211 RepID=A0A512HLJ1_9HYPH|nr:MULTISPECIES: DUF2125 domain-containing protein [Alphaproteobacteria]GEO86312.1 hypothetical protein RNA01_32440 [Ciceribacter naphthalenivorans]GLR21794.1 hypothetical protein GCM10007920_15810 [Ciceribacter naphthalenivorans]GLT04650.1 hypothetical protein GCM10007926_15810 [Sphingomonas psychrolutea]
MATSREKNRSTASRKVARLAVAIAVAILVYSGLWFAAAGAIEKKLGEILSGDNPAAIEAACTDRTVGGFPFRLGVTCAQLTVDDHFHGLSATFGAFRSAAQFYAPGHVLWELEGPAQVRSSLGFSLALQWTQLHSSLSAGLSGLARSSIEVKDLQTLMTARVDGETIETKAPHAEAHVRRSGDDLDLAVLARDAVMFWRGQPPLLPPLSASVDMTLIGKAKYLDLEGDRGEGLYGSQAEIRRFVADMGEGRVLTLSGPISVGTDGMLSGQLHVEVEGIKAWRTALRTSFPEERKTIDNAADVLGAIFGGKDKGKADLTVTDGVVSLGIFPIAVLPPL